jgi:Secretion system C-terminal sorting domain
MLLRRFTLLLLMVAAFQQLATAQRRYLEPVFPQVSATTVIYGQNFTVLPLVAGGRPARQPLVARVYAPVGDTDTKRPLIIYLKTGNFFPFPANGSCGGTVNDSSNVEFATRLAKMGYVVAVADYRGGWNPTANDPITGELTRRFTLINAAYRGLQDVRTCIRYFRRNVAELGNQFGVDPDKIVVWGQGTGGYLSLATAYLNTYNEIVTTGDPLKFTIPTPAGPVPMVLQPYNGDIYGNPPAPLTVCLVDATYSALSGGVFLAGDTLCVPNHVGYSSDFNLAVNMGGALGDSTWMDPGEMPLISFHNPADEFAPCFTDILNVPTANGPLPVMEVSGSCEMQAYADKYGLNEIFNTIPAGADPYGDVSLSSHVGYYPFVNTPNNSASPWEWTKVPTTPPTPADCNGDAASSRLYIDTIIGFYAPRACVALALGCNFVSIKEINDFEVGLKVAPVPAVDAVNFVSEKEQMRSIYVYDLNGRLVKAHVEINANSFRMQRNSLPNGLYVAEVRYDAGFVKRRIVFSNN